MCTWICAVHGYNNLTEGPQDTWSRLTLSKSLSLNAHRVPKRRSADWLIMLLSFCSSTPLFSTLLHNLHLWQSLHLIFPERWRSRLCSTLVSNKRLVDGNMSPPHICNTTSCQTNSFSFQSCNTQKVGSNRREGGGAEHLELPPNFLLNSGWTLLVLDGRYETKSVHLRDVMSWLPLDWRSSWQYSSLCYVSHQSKLLRYKRDMSQLLRWIVFLCRKRQFIAYC